jgi:hypothetical protein
VNRPASQQKCANAAPRLRFGLKNLFGAVTLIGVFLGLVHLVGLSAALPTFLIVSAILGLLLAAIRAPADRKVPWLELSCLGAIAGILWLLLQPARFGPEYSSRTVCQSNLRQIALAMHQYHDAYGSLPPAYLPDENGKPMHSWRVLLLPFLEEGDLYADYDFNEPWDGPNNRRLADRTPSVYLCANRDKWNPWTERYTFSSNAPMTSYVLVTGKGTAFDGSSAVTLDEIADGPENTLLAVEIANSHIHWMQPRDLPIDQISFRINDPTAKLAIRSNHPDGANVVFANAAARFIPSDLAPQTVRALITIDGGEDVGEPF